VNVWLLVQNDASMARICLYKILDPSLNNISFNTTAKLNNGPVLERSRILDPKFSVANIPFSSVPWIEWLTAGAAKMDFWICQKKTLAFGRLVIDLDSVMLQNRILAPIEHLDARRNGLHSDVWSCCTKFNHFLSLKKMLAFGAKPIASITYLVRTELEGEALVSWNFAHFWWEVMASPINNDRQIPVLKLSIVLCPEVVVD
jgi:hypothetical protein